MSPSSFCNQLAHARRLPPHMWYNSCMLHRQEGLEVVHTALAHRSAQVPLIDGDL